MNVEEWRAIPDWPEYEVSSLGRVRGIDRVTVRSNGSAYTVRGRIRQPFASEKDGYPRVSLERVGFRRTRTVHSLVAEAFLGPRPPGAVVRHLDGMPLNCTPDNLAYGSCSDNVQDMLRHGRCAAKLRTRCPQQHLLVLPNLRANDWRRGRRSCLACNRARGYCKRHPELPWEVVADRYYAEIMTGVAT